MLTVLVALLTCSFFQPTIGDKVLVLTGKPFWNGGMTEILDLNVYSHLYKLKSLKHFKL